MKNVKLYAIFLSMLLLPVSVFAVGKITIVNHYDQPLRILLGNNPTVVPDLHDELMIPVDSAIETRVQKISDSPDEGVGYVSTLDANDSNISAFWGVGLRDDSIVFHTYYVPREKLAYSWNASENTIVFCTKAAYTQKGSCL